MSTSSTPDHVAHLLPGFVAATLASAERRQVLTHLGTCAACQAELAAWRAIGRAACAASPTRPEREPESDAVLGHVWQRVDEPLRANRSGRRAFPRSAARSPVARGVPAGAPVPDRRPAPAPRSRPVPPRVPRGAGTMPSLAAAFLVLVAVSLALLVVGRDRFLSGRSPLLPAGSGIAAVPLLDVTVPPALLPQQDPTITYLLHVTVPPHRQAERPPDPGGCCAGVRLLYVVHGTLIVRVAGAGPLTAVGQLAHPGDRPTPLVAGADTPLGAGDALVLGAAVPFAATNPEATPVDLIQQLLTAGDVPQALVTLPGWTAHDTDWTTGAHPTGALRLRLQRVDLPAGAMVPPPAGAVQQYVALPAPNDGATPTSPLIARLSDGTLQNDGVAPVTLYVLSLQAVGPP
jgi:hypothetical protein